MYGNEIKKIRTERGVTQTEVAKATGLPQNTISWIEKDKGIANIQQCVLLADYYGITLDELIGRKI
ncbi:MAG: helix-turn-helix transcriptional regulator [Clostridia bacterium]|nr:helix-turn-helix transcriptional regulator [Clostridia bacterium]